VKKPANYSTEKGKDGPRRWVSTADLFKKELGDKVKKRGDLKERIFGRKLGASEGMTAQLLGGEAAWYPQWTERKVA